MLALVVSVLALVQAMMCGLVTWKVLERTDTTEALYFAAAYLVGILGLRWVFPTLGYGLGIVLAYGWAAALGASAYVDPNLRGHWMAIVAFALVGLALGAVANLVNPLRPWTWAASLPSRALRAVWALRPKRSRTEHRGTDSASRPAPPPPPQAGADPWSVLGVPRGANATEIQSAYRQRMREYHPDRVQTLGAEIRELAERKAKQINAAYTELTGS
jgi:hypothetical protein